MRTGSDLDLGGDGEGHGTDHDKGVECGVSWLDQPSVRESHAVAFAAPAAA